MAKASNPNLFAKGDADRGPVFDAFEHDPLPDMSEARSAAVNALILCYAARRHIERARQLGGCPADLARQVRHDLRGIDAAMPSEDARAAAPDQRSMF
jgi:hypothetical protein